ncbi:MAG: ABC transporter substrate-binding protein [Clostridiales bacterium]|nr:ABC transporter substrate-binding protein [Clostridiales bacterium]
MKKISILLVIFVSVFSIMMTGCGKKDDNKIRISEVTHSLFYAPLYVAMNNGYFEDEGLEIELSNAGGSDTVMSSLISNSADVGLMGPESCVYVRNNGMENAPVIFAQLTACDGSFLVGRTDEADTFNWENLRGKHIIAGRKGGMPAMTLQYILEQKGLNPGAELSDTVDTIMDTTIAFNLTTSSFVANTGDYCTMFDPAASQCELDGTGYIVAALGDEVSDVPYTCFVATNSYLNNNGDKLDKFMRALKKGYDYLMTANDTEIISALKPSFETTSDALILASVKNYIRIGAYASSFVLKESSWNNMLDIIDNAGELKAVVDWNDAVNTSFATKVA